MSGARRRFYQDDLRINNGEAGNRRGRRMRCGRSLENGIRGHIERRQKRQHRGLMQRPADGNRNIGIFQFEWIEYRTSYTTSPMSWTVVVLPGAGV